MEASNIWTAVGALGAFITALISLFLLHQGQQDRRRLRADEKRSQATKVTMSLTQGASEAPISARDWPGRILSIYNGSDQPVFLTRAIFVANPNGGPTVDGDLKSDYRGDPLDVGSILPASTSSVPVPAEYLPTIGVYGDFVIVEFLDATGAEWRRRSDSFELERLHDFDLTSIQRFVHTLGRVAPFYYLLFRLANNWVRRAHRQRPERVSTVVRLVEWLHGPWPAGSRDRWLVPSSAHDSNLYFTYPTKRETKQLIEEATDHNAT